jgi:hypothetical protein
MKRVKLIECGHASEVQTSRVKRETIILFMIYEEETTIDMIDVSKDVLLDSMGTYFPMVTMAEVVEDMEAVVANMKKG